MNPSLPGWKIECVGDDIAWMKFDEQGMVLKLDWWIVQCDSLLESPRLAKILEIIKTVLFTYILSFNFQAT